MLSRLSRQASTPLVGIALAAAGYSMFSIQDATVKWLVTTYAVTQILFIRSVLIVALSAYIIRRNGHPSILKSPHRKSLVLRALLMLVAWLFYYSAARHLGLAELTTLYFCAPIMVVALSILVLKEKVGLVRWLSCIGGFGGVLLAANPAGTPSLVPAGMVLIAGFCWAWSTILVRLVSRSESTINQMMATSLSFVVACGVTLPFVWQWPDANGWILMIGLGCVSAIGQFLLYEGFRHAPASALAPIEYTGLIWAFLFGYLIWADVPTWHVISGALLIAGSSLLLIWWERRVVLLARRATGA